MAVVPELRSDPKLITRHHAIAEGSCEGLADLGFIAVDRGAVDMAVAQLQRSTHGAPHLAGVRFPGAESQNRRAEQCGHLGVWEVISSQPGGSWAGFIPWAW